MNNPRLINTKNSQIANSITVRKIVFVMWRTEMGLIRDGKKEAKKLSLVVSMVHGLNDFT